MRLENYISKFKKTNRRRLSSLFRRESNEKRNTKLATSHRRHGRRRSIRSYWKDTWDAVKVSRRMERVLQPTEGNSQSERIREKKKRGEERAVTLKRLYEDKDFQYLWGILEKWEAMAYEDLARPELRKKGTTLAYYMGFMSGRIGTLSDIKDLVIRSVVSYGKRTE